MRRLADGGARRDMRTRGGVTWEPGAGNGMGHAVCVPLACRGTIAFGADETRPASERARHHPAGPCALAPCAYRVLAVPPSACRSAFLQHTPQASRPVVASHALDAVCRRPAWRAVLHGKPPRHSRLPPCRYADCWHARGTPQEREPVTYTISAHPDARQRFLWFSCVPSGTAMTRAPSCDNAVVI